MNRKQALELIKLAIAEGDTRTATRIYADNRISREAFNDACYSGTQLKAKLAGRNISTTKIGDL